MSRHFLKFLSIAVLFGISGIANAGPLEGNWQRTAAFLKSDPFNAYATEFLVVNNQSMRQIEIVGPQTGAVYSDTITYLNDHQFLRSNTTYEYSISGQTLSLYLSGIPVGSYSRVSMLPNLNHGAHSVPQLTFKTASALNSAARPSQELVFNPLPDSYDVESKLFEDFVGPNGSHITAHVEFALLKNDFNNLGSYFGYVYFHSDIDGNMIGQPSPIFSLGQGSKFVYSITDPKYGKIDYSISWKN